PPAFEPEPVSDEPSGFADFKPVFSAAPPPTRTLEPFEAAAAPQVRSVEARTPRRDSTDAMRSLTAPLARGARRAAPIAAVLAVVVGAVWMGRPYVDQVKSWLTDMTAADPPKAEGVVA